MDNGWVKNMEGIYTPKATDKPKSTYPSRLDDPFRTGNDSLDGTRKLIDKFLKDKKYGEAAKLILEFRLMNFYNMKELVMNLVKSSNTVVMAKKILF